MASRVTQWLRQLVGKGENENTSRGEADVEIDPAEARSRRTGGTPGHDEGASASTTGPGESGSFVGRVAGQDVGYAGQTGAEARAEDSG